MISKENFLKKIEFDIKNNGYHLNIVTNGPCPRFAYTIGMIEKIGFELIFAGGLFFNNDETCAIIDNIIGKLKNNRDLKTNNFEIESLGFFSLSNVDTSWSKLVMLGAYDFYQKEEISALQVLPDHFHSTLDIPNLSNSFDANNEPIWKWLKKGWEYQIPNNITVVTNLKALFGETITEIMRWEEDEWEMFSDAGPDIPKEEIRIVPIGTILGIDNSIEVALDLEIGKGIWREEKNKNWNKWG